MRNLYKKFGISIFVLSLSSVSCFAFTGKVTKVIDGDTIDVQRDDNKKTVRVRLADIDAPELQQPYGDIARDYLVVKTMTKHVEVKDEGKKPDQYGRIIGDLYVGDFYVNAAIVKDGYAWAYRYKGEITNNIIGISETSARSRKINIWSQSHPVEPWIWRKEHKKALY